MDRDWKSCRNNERWLKKTRMTLESWFWSRYTLEDRWPMKPCNYTPVIRIYREVRQTLERGFEVGQDSKVLDPQREAQDGTWSEVRARSGHGCPTGAGSSVKLCCEVVRRWQSFGAEVNVVIYLLHVRFVVLCNNAGYYCQNDVVKTYRGAILETKCVFVVADLEMLRLPEEEAICEERNIYRNMNRQNELWWRRRRDKERNSISCTNRRSFGRGLQATSAIIFRYREMTGQGSLYLFSLGACFFHYLLHSLILSFACVCFVSCSFSPASVLPFIRPHVWSPVQ